MRLFKYMENNSEPRDIAFGRLDCYMDDDVPQEIIENISNVIELDAIPKKLCDYSEAEIESFSRLALHYKTKNESNFSHFPELANQSDYSVLDKEPHYPYTKTLLEKAGLEGSLQEHEFKKDLNLDEFYTKEHAYPKKDNERWLDSTAKYV